MQERSTQWISTYLSISCGPHPAHQTVWLVETAEKEDFRDVFCRNFLSLTVTKIPPVVLSSHEKNLTFPKNVIDLMSVSIKFYRVGVADCSPETNHHLHSRKDTLRGDRLDAEARRVRVYRGPNVPTTGPPRVSPLCRMYLSTNWLTVFLFLFVAKHLVLPTPSQQPGRTFV